jgi:predicted nucleic acid-binding protein
LSGVGLDLPHRPAQKAVRLGWQFISSGLERLVRVILPLDVAAAELAGRITGDLDRGGQTIGRADPIIAAVAVVQGLAFVTGNTAHYQRIQRLGYPLTLVNWR